VTAVETEINKSNVFIAAFGEARNPIILDQSSSQFAGLRIFGTFYWQIEFFIN